MTQTGSGQKTLCVTRTGYALHAEALAPNDFEAPWIVFGNSLLTDCSIWDAQVDALAENYGILRYDQLGHGRSDAPRFPVDFDLLGADLLAVMDAAGVDRAIYVGLSMGVPTGLSAHRIAPHRFTALVFASGQAKTAPGGAAGWAQRIEGAEASGMQDFAEATADRWLTGSASANTRARLTRMIANTSFDGFRACAAALMNYDYSRELARIACPTLLLAGSEDGAMPESMATNLQSAIAGSELQVIAQAGHVPCFEQPQAFTAALAGFLETLLAKDAS